MNKLSYIFQYIMYYIINQSNGSVNKSRLSVQNKPLKRRVQLHGEKNQYNFEGPVSGCGIFEPHLVYTYFQGYRTHLFDLL